MIGARTPREESVIQAIGVERMVMGPLNLPMEEVKKFAYTGWAKYLVNQQLYCTRNAQGRGISIVVSALSMLE